ncbi:DUF1289 domain-containing protein [Dyella sp. A6]|uniref:DUF1289 domain-containing protein n=1 Tax=Dyella aluminiiresistens TaxID=3069105 RepID=UPI002E776E27|nr:DUF1289 domain-containing protein [Dyella sp. A6]
MSNVPLASPSLLTPCIGICRLDSAGLCLGCRRTGDEIAGWRDLSDDERRRWMDEVLPMRPPA